MPSDSGHALVVVLSLLGLSGLLGSLSFLCSSFPNPHDSARLVVMTLLILGFYRVILMIRQLFIRSSKKSLPEYPQNTFFNHLGAPLSEELVRLFTVVAISHATGVESMRSMACVTGALYAIEKQMWSFWLFSPVNYDLHYRKFLRYYDMYVRATQDGTQNPQSLLEQKQTSKEELLESSQNAQCGCSMEPCGDGSKSPTSVDSLTTLVPIVSLDSPAPLMKVTPSFNLNSFGDSEMTRSYLEPIDCLQRQYDNRPDAVDRLYTISPKNTLYLQYENFKLPPKISLPVDSEINLSSYILDQDTLSLNSQSPETETASINSHYGGGLGGNIEYKFPDGSKLKLGGGGGFDFRRGSKESKALINTIKNQQHNLMSSDYKWFCWLYCPHEHYIERKEPKHVVNATIRKQLSQYTLKNESTPLRVCASCPLYFSLDNTSISEDLESASGQQPILNAQLFYKFNRFANRYFDVLTYDIGSSLFLIDPAFIRFGAPLLELPPLYLVMYNLSTSIWQIFASLTFALPFSNRHLHGLVAVLFTVTVIAKLFSANYLHLQCSRSYKFSILVEFFINILMLSCIYMLYFIDQ